MVSAATQIEIVGLRLGKLGHKVKCKNKDETKIVDKQRQDLDELVQCIKDHKILMKSTFCYPF